MISRRMIQAVLGFAWLFDGLLQLKPQMFTSTFISQVITPTADGQPSWIANLVHWGANVAGAHIVTWNSVFALVQILLGVFLIFNFRIRETIVLSILWSVIVWVFGEGAGQIFTGQTLLITGAPGAVLLYALIAGAIWPKAKTMDWRKGGVRFAQLSLALLWLFGAILHLQPPYLKGDGLAQAVSVSWLQTVLAHHGVLASITLAAVEFALAAALIVKFHVRWVCILSVVLSLVFWWVGQSFGEITDPLATDINSAPMMALLALAACPRIFPKREPEHTDVPSSRNRNDGHRAAV